MVELCIAFLPENSLSNARHGQYGRDLPERRHRVGIWKGMET